MERLFLFATLAGTRIAVETSEVEAVVRLNDVSPVPGMGAHIAGLSALRSRVLTIIDVAALIHGVASPRVERGLAIIADISGHSYGLMVDGVTDMSAVRSWKVPRRRRRRRRCMSRVPRRKIPGERRASGLFPLSARSF